MDRTDKGPRPNASPGLQTALLSPVCSSVSPWLCERSVRRRGGEVNGEGITRRHKDTEGIPDGSDRHRSQGATPPRASKPHSSRPLVPLCLRDSVRDSIEQTVRTAPLPDASPAPDLPAGRSRPSRGGVTTVGCPRGHPSDGERSRMPQDASQGGGGTCGQGRSAGPLGPGLPPVARTWTRVDKTGVRRAWTPAGGDGQGVFPGRGSWARRCAPRICHRAPPNMSTSRGRRGSRPFVSSFRTGSKSTVDDDVR